MDLVGEMLARHLPPPAAPEQVLRPIRSLTPSFTANRIWLRFYEYPRWLRQNHHQFDIFHIVDHSYSQLAHELPPERTVVTCHDIDTFRSVLEPSNCPRGPLFRLMTRRILTGLARAAHVTCDSSATLQDLARHHVLPRNRMSVVPLGPHPACSPSPNPAADKEAERLLGPGPTLDIFHVGSTLVRKRIDVVLRVFAQARARFPSLRLLRAGGPLTPDQRALAHELGVLPALIELPFLERETLAAIYRRAVLVLLPSEAEGFGLPVTEAMACGTPVLASDLPVLQEVGGAAASYCPVADLPSWGAALNELLFEYQNNSQAWKKRQLQSIRQSSRFSWAAYSNCMLDVYNKLLQDCEKSVYESDI